jgi:NADH dehydrogenase [ubiquinone] 1 alpha subcomplex assembly factor 7
MSLHALLSDTIRAEGPLTVADYMALCLMHPEYGYYQKQRVFGRKGDFTTAPEISQVFGDVLGLWCIGAWQQLGEPSAFALCELGPGRGTLMSDVMRMVAKKPAMKQAAQIHLVEASEQLTHLQKEKLWPHQPSWHLSVETLPDNVPLILLANEFFDALPIRQWVGDVERRVTLTEHHTLAFTPDGPVTKEDCTQALCILSTLADKLRKQGGVLLLIDYGYVAPITENRDTLQAVRKHAYVNPLEHPGEADLTAHVDFSALAARAQKESLSVHGPLEQGPFLQKLGGDIWLQKLLAKAASHQHELLQSGYLRLISPAQMGSLFKVMALSSAALQDLPGF